jgi:hypothetical protein
MHIPGCLGIIVTPNGEALDVQWIDDTQRKHGEREISTELPEFLEVVSEAR